MQYSSEEFCLPYSWRIQLISLRDDIYIPLLGYLSLLKIIQSHYGKIARGFILGAGGGGEGDMLLWPPHPTIVFLIQKWRETVIIESKEMVFSFEL